MVKLSDLVLIIIIVNYFNIKKTTKLSIVLIAKSLKIDNDKIIGIDNNDN